MASYRKSQILLDVERDTILRCLAQAGGNVSKAAELLGLRRSTLHHKMKQHHVSRLGPVFAPPRTGPVERPVVLQTCWFVTISREGVSMHGVAEATWAKDDMARLHVAGVFRDYDTARRVYDALRARPSAVREFYEQRKAQLGVCRCGATFEKRWPNSTLCHACLSEIAKDRAVRPVRLLAAADAIDQRRKLAADLGDSTYATTGGLR